MNVNTITLMMFVALAATIVFTILAYAYIIPEKRKAKLNKLGQFVSDIFNFKFLVVEKILQFLYVLTTIACICTGICLLFGINIYHISYIDKTIVIWYGWQGLLLAIFGPIVVRLVYEGMMLFVLLVKNVIQINKKLKEQAEMDEYQMPAFKDLFTKENFKFSKDNNDTPNDSTQA